MRELAPTLIAVNQTVCNPDNGGDAQDIEIDFGAGDGARIVGIEFSWTHNNTTNTTYYGVSTDPNATAPDTVDALVIDTDVIAAAGYDWNFTTSGAGDVRSTYYPMADEVIITTRNLRILGHGDGSAGQYGWCRVHYNQVQFTADELRAITIVNR